MTDRLPPRGKITDRATAEAIARRYAGGELPLPNREPIDPFGEDDGIRDEQDRIESIIQRIYRSDEKPIEREEDYVDPFSTNQGAGS